MKKGFLITLIAFAFLACEGPEGPMGPRGPQGEQGYGTDWYTTTITIHEDDWQLVGQPGELNSYFFVDIPMDKISKFVYEEGTVLAYIETEKDIKRILPYVSHRGMETDGKEYLWTQTYDFDYYRGGIGLYVTYSDFLTQVRPSTEKFHIVLMW